MMVDFSCVIPTHNRADYLALSIESALRQSLPPAEIIVVSDCVDDAAREACADLSAASSIPIHYIELAEGPGGASFSRNAGAARASGDYLAFLDDDDLWESEYLRSASELIADSDADLVVTWITEFTDESRRSGPRISERMRAQDVAALNPGATGSNMVVRTRVWAAVGGFDNDLKVKNDTDFLYRLLRVGASYRVAATHLVLQRKHQSGQLTARTEKRAIGTEAYLRKHLASLTSSDVRTLRQQVHRIRSYSSRRALTRAWHALAMARYYQPRELLRKIIQGRDRRHVRVAASSEDV